MGPPPLPQSSPAEPMPLQADDVPFALPLVDPLVADDADLTCPLCGYDLRGLPERRCSECGHAFDPGELRRAKAERREWFFEHARRRLPWAFVVTAFVSLNPISFWRRVQAAHQIEPRRLTLWWTAWIAIAIAVMLALLGNAVYAERNGGAGNVTTSRVPGRWTANGRFAPTPVRLSPTPPTIDWSDAFDRATLRRTFVPSTKVVIAAIAWPSIAAMAMNVFATTLRAAGVSQGHVRRCTHYALPLTLLPTFAIVLVSVVVGWDTPRVVGLSGLWYLTLFHLNDVAGVAFLAAIAGSTLHLVTSHVRYLRLPQAAITALLAQTVAWLMIAVVLLFVGAIA